MKYELVWYLLKLFYPDSHVMSTDISRPRAPARPATLCHNAPFQKNTHRVKKKLDYFKIILYLILVLHDSARKVPARKGGKCRTATAPY